MWAVVENAEYDYSGCCLSILIRYNTKILKHLVLITCTLQIMGLLNLT